MWFFFITSIVLMFQLCSNALDNHFAFYIFYFESTNIKAIFGLKFYFEKLLLFYSAFFLENMFGEWTIKAVFF